MRKALKNEEKKQIHKVYCFGVSGSVELPLRYRATHKNTSYLLVFQIRVQVALAKALKNCFVGTIAAFALPPASTRG